MRGAWPDFQNRYHMKPVLKKQEFARRPVERRRQQNEVSDLQGVRSSGQAGSVGNKKQVEKELLIKVP